MVPKHSPGLYHCLSACPADIQQIQQPWRHSLPRHMCDCRSSPLPATRSPHDSQRFIWRCLPWLSEAICKPWFLGPISRNPHLPLEWSWRIFKVLFLCQPLGKGWKTNIIPPSKGPPSKGAVGLTDSAPRVSRGRSCSRPRWYCWSGQRTKTDHGWFGGLNRIKRYERNVAHHPLVGIEFIEFWKIIFWDDTIYILYIEYIYIVYIYYILYILYIYIWRFPKLRATPSHQSASQHLRDGLQNNGRVRSRVPLRWNFQAVAMDDLCWFMIMFAYLAPNWSYVQYWLMGS